MINKKGFEIQFNWLFVLVAGAAILLFFTAIVAKQKTVAETSIKSTVLKSVEAILTGAGVSTDTINIVDVPNSNIEVSCGRISLGTVSKQFQNLILFSPNVIKGDKLITQTLAFNSPYRATNLLYITSPQVRYIIVGDNNLAKEINKSLPSDIKKEFYQSSPTIKNENNYKVKFIVFGNMIEFPSSLEKMPDSDVTAVRVNGDLNKGEIEFYQKEKNLLLPKGKSFYLGKSSLIGAIYADSLDIYECSMRNAFLKLNLVTKIYNEKAKELIRKTSSLGRQLQCQDIYNKALANLNKIMVSSSSFTKENIDTISEAAKALANENKNAQTYSCPVIY